jgi:CYTH domain-containing protein
MMRNEYEYAIPLCDAEEMLRTICGGIVLEKFRYFILHEGDTWHVDVYEGLLDGFVLAEIELTDVDQTFILPEWIGREVTADPRYRKINMARAASLNEINRKASETSESAAAN